jgi:polyhydroxyalkanoate synthesis regulator phasin
MPQPPDWKRALATGMQFTELRRSQAHRLATELVAQGQLARDQIGAAVDELIEISRTRSEELRTIVSTEVQRQLGVLGLATKNDLVALERRLRPAPARKSASEKGPAKKARAATARKPAAKKAPAKKATKKPAVKKPARKAGSTTKKTAKRKPAAKRTR